MADGFYNADLGTCHFLRGPNGRVSGFTLTTGRVRRLRFVKT